MSGFRKFLKRVGGLFNKGRKDHELDAEIESHLQLHIDDNLRAGMSPDEARRQAMIKLGGIDSTKEAYRDQRGLPLLETLWQDIRFGARMLRKNRGFTTVAVLTLALCIGANLAIFAVIDSVLLRRLPFRDPDQLVTMFNSYPKMGLDRADSSYPNYYNRRGNIAAFSQVAAFRDTTAVVGEAGATELTELSRVSPEFFATLGVQPSLGRAFLEEEMTYQSDAVVMLSDAYWRQKFNANPDVIGRTLRVDGVAKTVVGVLPASFRFLSSKARFFQPLSSDRDERDIQRLHSPSLTLVARLKPGVTLAQAQAQIDVHDATMALSFPDRKIAAEAGFHTVMKPLHADHVASIRPTILLLQAGVFSLLLIGGVNLVNLLLIQASGRSRELAIRQSLGAKRHHLVTQVIVETVLLALIGGLLGLVVGAMGIRLLTGLGLEQLPMGAQVVFDGRLAFIALSGTLVLGAILGLPIAWFNLRNPLAGALQSDSRGGTASRAAQRLRHGFIVAQIALAFVLLTGAGLLGVSLNRVMSVSPGFRPDHVLTGRITLPWNSYQDWGPRLEFTDRLLERTKQLPGVVAAGIITDMPVKRGQNFDVMTVEDYQLVPGAPPILHNIYWVSGEYFDTMGISLREGRFLESADSRREIRTCVVDEDFARTYWPKGSALGKRISRGPPEERPDTEEYTIVGVVNAVKPAELTDPRAGRGVYFPYRYGAADQFFLVTRTSLAPESFAMALQKTVREVDPELPLSDLRTMETRIADSLIAQRSSALLGGIFATVALLLAAIGTYGVLAFAVAQRRREIGIRMALGAMPKQIAAEFLTIGLRLLIAGIILGVLGAWLAGNAMQALLFNMPTVHLMTLLGTIALMTLVSLSACWLPTRRAARVDPMVALRSE